MVGELVTEHFVPCADEVWRLQNLDAPDCQHFMSFCDDGPYGRLNAQDESATRQGTYCVSPSGILLGSWNHRDPRRMEQLLRSSLERWNELSREERLLDVDPRETAKSIRRAELQYPEDGLVLRVDVRDLPREWKGAHQPDPDDWRTLAWNHDYAWFRRGEVARLVPTERELEVGTEWDLPADLVERTFRLHLVDIARGQTIHYAREQVRAASLRATVTGVEDGVAELRLEGAIHLVDADRERGIRGSLLGRATVEFGDNGRDGATRRFTAFEVVCVADRWGTTQFNRRHDDLGPAPIGFALRLASDHPTERVAPTAFWEYRWR